MDPYGSKIRGLKDSDQDKSNEIKMWVDHAQSLPDGDDKWYALAKARALAKGGKQNPPYPNYIKKYESTPGPANETDQ